MGGSIHREVIGNAFYVDHEFVFQNYSIFCVKHYAHFRMFGYFLISYFKTCVFTESEKILFYNWKKDQGSFFSIFFKIHSRLNKGLKNISVCKHLNCIKTNFRLNCTSLMVNAILSDSDNYIGYYRTWILFR